MIDTTITPEERAEIRRLASQTHRLSFNDKLHEKLDKLLKALEQAEARAEKAEAERKKDLAHCKYEFERAEDAEAENTRLQQRVNELLSEELTDGAARERIQLRGNMHEFLQQNERLTKMVDWLAEKHIRCAANGDQWYGPTIGKELHVPMYPSKTEAIDALKEAARRAVADTESEMEG